MSCLDIMYQPYASYFPYQRTGATSSTMDHLKKFGAMGKMSDGLDPLNYSIPGGGGGGTLTPSSSGSGGSVVAKEEADPERDAQQPTNTQYLASNCVLLTYFAGDISANVDDHFTRALSGPSSFNTENQGSKPPSTWKEVSPMSQRNFPPSFWNSSYQPPPSTLHGVGHQDPMGFGDPYSHMTGGLHSMSGLQDPWRYPLTSQPHAYSHHPVPDFSYAGTSRFNPGAYSSLLPSSRLTAMPSQCDLKHTDAWSSRYHNDPLGSNLTSQLTSHHDTTTSHLHGLGGGIEAPTATATAVQETSTKDLYWF